MKQVVAALVAGSAFVVTLLIWSFQETKENVESEKKSTTDTISDKMKQVVAALVAGAAFVVTLLIQSFQETKENVESGKSSTTACHQMEVDFELETDLRERYNCCQKNPGHKEFICVDDLSVSSFPLPYQAEDLVELIKLQAALAVRVQVRGSSEHRPQVFPKTEIPYPFSGKRDRKAIRTGSGWVRRVEKYTETHNSDCYCDLCKKTNQPVKSWGKISICTATHAVFDLNEGKKTTCYFGYDNDNIKLEDCPSVHGSVQVKSNIRTDSCELIYLTHDMDLVDELDKICKKYLFMDIEVKDRFMPEQWQDEDKDLAEKLAVLYERCSHAINVVDQLKDKLATILNGDILKYWQDYVDTSNDDKPDELGIILADRIKAGVHGKDHLDLLCRLYKLYTGLRNEVGRLIDLFKQFPENEYARKKVQKLYIGNRGIMVEHDKYVRYYKELLFRNDKFEESAKPVYNPEHPLCVIISHPHGCSKKVTIGQITKRETVLYNQLTKYVYTNATCPGSSGARIFILGKTGLLPDHAHSGTSESEASEHTQLNESAVQRD